MNKVRLTDLLQATAGECDGGNCDRRAVSFAFSEEISGLIPVCRQHIAAYQVLNGTRWQAEDEYADLRFARRSRWKWLAQRRILHDQRVQVRHGRPSRAQRRKTLRAGTP